jgi:hypothetical protein
MARPVPCLSIRVKILIGFFCLLVSLCLHAPLASAQHGGVHAGGGVPHFSPPPPASHAPVSHAPVAPPHAVLAPRPGAFGTGAIRYHPPRPIQPVPPVFPIYPYPIFWGGPYYGFGWGWGWGWGWGLSSCWWWPTCDLFWNYGLTYNSVPFYGYGPSSYAAPPATYEYPQYTYSYGDERWDLPQLYLKDGSVLNVTDYWLIDDQLHYSMIEQGKPVEHVIPFDQLDLQTTVNVASQRGFRFVLRNEPVEQYLQHHPDATPPPVLRRENNPQ